MNAIDLASLLCSRLCHDLLSPVGALNNGIELLADEPDPDMRERCLELLAESARASANKLKFFRLAFGAGGGFGDEIDTREARGALEGLYGAEKRIELGWMVAGDQLPKGAIKLLLNLAMIAGDALVRGGRLDVGAERGDDGIEMVIRAEGPRVLVDPTLRETMVKGAVNGMVEPRAAGAWLAHGLIAEAGGTIQLSDASADTPMDDLIADFVAECREMLEALGGEIVAWEASPDDRARLDSIFRFVHTVKGNCGFFDFPRLEALSHAAEDALADCRAGRRAPDHALVSAVLAVIDRIGEMVAAIEAGEEFSGGGDEALITALEPGAEAAAVATPVETSADIALKNSGAAPRTIRLSVELLDRVMSGVSDMVLARNELARRLREASGDVMVDGAFERLSGIIAEMRDAITRTRMQRIENLFVALPRMVRDLSGELGKQVLVDIEGGDVELDREMIEMIRDPLTHIIRNAVDHGIEAPAARLKAGKREIGILSVSARQSGNQILIDIVDDGRGIDGARLVEKAISSGTLSKEDAAALSPRERLALVFEAGLSTAQSVTAISGRGVGMDVVRSNVERIGGIVEVDSTVGRGTRMTLRVPLTLTIIPALTVSIGSQHFAIPRAAIEEIVRANGSSVTLERVGGAGIATIRGRRVPEISLADVLGIESTMSDSERTLVVLKPAGGDLFALAVDRIHDHEELVVKPAAPAVMATGLYAGTTLADDGSPILLFDPAGLAEVGGIRLEMQERGSRVVEEATKAAVPAEVPVLLFRGLDGARRALRLGIVDRIEEVPATAIRPGAGRLRVQLGEAILPLAGVDPGTSFEGKVRLFRLNDGSQEIGYAFAEVIDLMTIDHDVIPASSPGQVSGVTLIGGEPAELVDAHWLFAEYLGSASRPAAPLVCRLASDDPWMQNMLRPIVEAAGYIVIGESDELIPDLVIQSDGQPATKTGSARILTLAADPETADGKGCIYRYDRAGLMMALKTAGSGSGQ